MELHGTKFKIRLGAFIVGGLILFVFTIFIIGRQKNLFNPVFTLTTNFYNVSGLQVGNNIRFSGINVGTVDNITIINDSTVRVDMLIRKEIRQFIKSDCQVAIGSEGLIGDRLLVISQGSAGAPLVKNRQHLLSTEPVETDAIMASLQVTAGNAEIISKELADIMMKVNSGKGIFWRLVEDSTMAENIDRTLINLEKSSENLNQDLKAVQSNILLKGYFKKKAKEEEKQK